MELLGAMQRNLGVLELHLVIRDGGLRGVAIGFRRIERAFDVGIIEGSKELALRHASAFIEEDAGDAAGNLGGDGGTAARGDVAAGIQQRLESASVGFGGSSNLDHGLLVAEREGCSNDARKDDDRDRGVEDAFAHLRLAPLSIVDAQRAKVRFCRDLWTGHQPPAPSDWERSPLPTDSSL